MGLPHRTRDPLQLAGQLNLEPGRRSLGAHTLATHACLLVIASMLLVSAGQPIAAEDTWWHLGMGAVYAADGPWLDADPFLFSAQGPPAPAAWLADLLLYGVQRAAGFFGLRLLHVLCVATILLLAWCTARGASDSASFASLATTLFAVLAAYRLFQLRPHLFSMLATLLVVHYVVTQARAPVGWRAAALGLLFALWANLHGGFVLGLALLAAALGGSLVAARWRPAELAGARNLASALLAATLGSLANPAGARPHLLFFAAGAETPELGVVGDEWARFDPFSLPSPLAPPSLLDWILILLILLAFAAAALRSRERATSTRPALLAAGLAACAGMLLAVRLSWLGFVPLLFIAQATSGRAVARAGAVVCVLVSAAFPILGDWPWISRGISLDRYHEPYPAAKFQAHAAWFLDDSQLSGRLWTDYRYGNFYGTWLAPRMQVFVNGSLNVPREVLEASLAIRRGEGHGGEDFLTLLDRYAIDLFVGTGIPALAPGRRPEPVTTAHLEAAPGWIPVFRSIGSAVYLRDATRNRPNLERVADYYAARGVPFDRKQGFDPVLAAEHAPEWSAAHGVAPGDHSALVEALRSRDSAQRAAARERQAAILALLGACDEAIRIDEQRRAAGRQPRSALRRLAWCHLRLGEATRARAAALRLEELGGRADFVSRQLIEAIRGAELMPDDAEVRRRMGALPVTTRSELEPLLRGFRPPVARPWDGIARLPGAG